METLHKHTTNIIFDSFNISYYSNDTLYTHSIGIGKYWEPHITNFLKIYNDNFNINNIIDIGANAGYHSLYFSRFASGTVYAVEPHPDIFKLLELNIKNNNITNITPLNNAIGNNDGIVYMGELEFTREANLGDLHVYNNKNKYPINCVKLDSLILPSIDFIKIDVQGFELMVLEGSIDLIKTHNPVFIVEIEHIQLRHTNTQPHQIIEFFNDNNYDVYSLKYSYLSDYVCVPKNNSNFREVFGKYMITPTDEYKKISGDIDINRQLDIKYKTHIHDLIMDGDIK